MAPGSSLTASTAEALSRGAIAIWSPNSSATWAALTLSPQPNEPSSRRAASLCVWCEAVEVRLAAGEEIDIAPYTTAANSLRRLLVDIGFERRAKEVMPSLDVYVRAKR